ncbi:MAG: hypothetical protein EBS00_06030 [Verrucomicrobia bacterium]|nr:hypothetical protein [Verrucomicrobiota bacterium]
MEILLKSHKHYGSLLLVLVLAVVMVALVKGPKPVFQRIVAVLVDINVVVGLIALGASHKSISLLHPLFALGAIGLLHAAAKSEDKAKVVKCFSIAFLLLILTWAVNASWGPSFLKGLWMISL